MNTARRNLLGLFLIPVLMFGFGYLMVPIYNVFCDLTGLNGKTGRLSFSEAEALETNEDKWIKVEFLASLNQNAPWQFDPAVASMMVHPGKPYRTHYIAQNTLDREMVGQAVPSVSPGKAAAYFKKTECFCFNQQTFASREKREMPLVFIVDPDLPDDIDTVTLSYTFFDTNRAG